jgi:hypothetical protein
MEMGMRLTKLRKLYLALGIRHWALGKTSKIRTGNFTQSPNT